MIVVDTSFLVAFFNEHDNFHQKAILEMKSSENEIKLISDYVIAETCTVLNNKIGLHEAMMFLEAVKKIDNVEAYHLDENDFENTAEIFKKQKHKLSFTDASIIQLAKTMRSEIATFDVNIIKEFEALRTENRFY